MVNTGDLVHQKLDISPELVRDVTVHVETVAKIAPYIICLGNHDLNLKNPGRIDAISPMVRNLSTVNLVELLTRTESFPWDDRREFWFHNFSIKDQVHSHKIDSDKVNIGLYHGSIKGATTDLGFTLEEDRISVDKFEGMDYVLMGDIHKRQSFKDGRIRYPGSLIQQNWGEEPEKGFLLWDIGGKDDFDVTFHPIETPGRFYTIQVPASLSLDDLEVPPGSRVRALVDGELNAVTKRDLERKVKERFSAVEFIAHDVRERDPAPLTLDVMGISRKKMMWEYLESKGLDEDDAEGVVHLFETLAAEHASEAKGTTWNLKKVSWDNVLNFGDGNVIDLGRLAGLVGIFAPNASGKSSVFDVITEGLFDRVTKDVPRNIDLINDNKESAKIKIELDCGGRSFEIDRTIERIKYQKKTKQWGKTDLDLVIDGTSHNGSSRPETERVIRSAIGTFDDFALTTLVSQSAITSLPGGGDIINCKEADRRKILARLLDLDSFEEVHAAAKDELKRLNKVSDDHPDQLTVDICMHEGMMDKIKQSIVDRKIEIADHLSKISTISSRLSEMKDLVETKKKLDGLRKEITQTKDSIDQNAAMLQSIAREIAKIDGEISVLCLSEPSIPPIGLDELSRKIRAIQERRNEEKTKLTKARETEKLGKKSLDVLNEVPCEGKFPTCKFISDAVSFLGDLPALEEAINEHRKNVESCEGQLLELSEFEVNHKAHSDWKRRFHDLEFKLSSLNGDRIIRTEQIKATKERLNVLTDRFFELERSIVGADELDTLTGQRKELQEKVKALEGKNDHDHVTLGHHASSVESLTRRFAEAKEARSRASFYETLVEMTGRDGLPYKILSSALPVINASIARILSGAVKFSVFFEEDPEERTVGLFLRYGDYKSRPLSLGSGAERFVASLAIRAALIAVTSLPKTDILVVDEGFGKLDPEHLDSLQRIFEYLKGMFRVIFVVSHVDYMRDIVDHTVEITSKDGYAHVEVG